MFSPSDSLYPMRKSPKGTWVGNDTSPILGSYARTWHGTPATYQEVLDRQIGVKFAPLGVTRRRALEPRPGWSRRPHYMTALQRPDTTPHGQREPREMRAQYVS